MHIEKNPATVFMKMWLQVSALKPSIRANATDPCYPIRERVRAILNIDGLSHAMAAFDQLLSLPELSELDSTLAVMVEIDQIFGLIHPRAFAVSPGHGVGSRHVVPAWLSELKRRRRSLGSYVESTGVRVIPRGPLTRSQREENASSADSVADRFAYLSVVPCEVLENNRIVPVRMVTIEIDPARGALIARSPGTEVVGFVPVAEEVGDVIQASRESHGKYFVDFSPHPDLNSASRFMEAISRSEPVDIAMAPELVMPHQHAVALPNLIVKSPLRSKERPRIFVAGSGASLDKEYGQNWNESTILNSVGAVLWKQRKVQQAGIARNRAQQFGLPDPGDGKMVMEDNASGDEVVVADVAGLGRCVLIICQDIMARPFSEDIIRNYQPDWVFIPILDPEVFDGGWVHRRTHELSSESHARFLIATSTGLPRAATAVGAPCCGLAVGPQSAVDSTPGRQCAFVSSEHAGTPKLARVRWDANETYWKISKLQGA